MINNCPNCGKELKLTDAHKVKIKNTLSSLKANQVIKLGCPYCKKPIELNKDGQSPSSSIPEPLQPEADESIEQNDAVKPKEEPIQPSKNPPQPPNPPELDWLYSGKMEDKQIIEDVTKAMILMPASSDRDLVVSAFQDMEYQTSLTSDTEQAIERLNFETFSAIVYHTKFENCDFKDSIFHTYIKELPMKKRRYIYYVVIGPEFQSTYNLEALAYSVNLVINDKEISHIKLILKKGLQDHESLFGPYISMLKKHGKK
ncbi:MAG: hypothetical protein HQK76_11055 [Desulfobacterales bacterium]|nr:hypothetical protein [Desulfobacterales bacterium]